MENLVSSWSDGQSLPENYIFPPEKRPGSLHVPFGKSIPVVDIESQDRNNVIQQILHASQEFGFFQVVKHGVPEELMDDTMSVFKEFHAMPTEDKARECSRVPSQRCKLYTSSENYATEKIHYWRDALTHPCDDLEANIKFWPEKPQTYRKVVGSYVMEVRKLAYKILELICEGLGLESKYLSGELSEKPILMANHYPPCPDPCLTLGIAKHIDPCLITILFQGDVCGLQVFKDGEWLGVQPTPHAFIINVGYVLRIISNGKLNAAEHRVVTNSREPRTTASYFVFPLEESIIGPAKGIADDVCSPPLYRNFMFKEFKIMYVASTADPKTVEDFISIKQHTCNEK